MTVIILVGGFAGFLLAMRFKVFVLVPTVAVALIVVAAMGLNRGGGWMLAAMMASALSIQLGYIAGMIAMSLAANARIALQSARLKSVEPVRGAARR